MDSIRKYNKIVLLMLAIVLMIAGFCCVIFYNNLDTVRAESYTYSRIEKANLSSTKEYYLSTRDLGSTAAFLNFNESGLSARLKYNGIYDSQTGYIVDILEKDLQFDECASGYLFVENGNWYYHCSGGAVTKAGPYYIYSAVQDSFTATDIAVDSSRTYVPIAGEKTIQRSDIIVKIKGQVITGELNFVDSTVNYLQGDFSVTVNINGCYYDFTMPSPIAAGADFKNGNVSIDGELSATVVTFTPSFTALYNLDIGNNNGIAFQIFNSAQLAEIKLNQIMLAKYDTDNNNSKLPGAYVQLLNAGTKYYIVMSKTSTSSNIGYVAKFSQLTPNIYELNFNNEVDGNKNLYYYNYDSLDSNSSVVNISWFTYAENGMNNTEMLSITPPSKRGYSFLGFQNLDNEIVIDKDGQFNKKLSNGQSQTINAKWQANDYDIKYQLNGGVVENSPQKHTYDKNTVIPNATKRGYTFLGWRVNRLAESKDLILAGNGYVNYISLEAVWQVNVYDINYQLNGGIAENSPQKHTYDTSSVIPNATKRGYTFLGWKVNGLEECFDVILAGDVYVDNISLEAVWQVNVYNISYLLYDGKIENNPLTHTYDSDSVIPNATKRGYKFTGWLVNNNKIYLDLTLIGDGYLNDIVLEAVWRAETYSISYQLNGGDNLQYPTKHIYDIDTAVKNATMRGHTFLGWKVNGNIPTLNLVLSKYEYLDNIELEAIWQANGYLITYTLNDGSAEDLPNVHIYGAKTQIPNAQKSGYDFLGWKVNETDSVKNLILGSDEFVEDISLEALWIACNYNIFYQLNGGQIIDNPTSHQYDRDTTIPNAVRIGYNFVGWKINGLAPKLDVILNAKDYLDDINIQAEWEAIEYTIVFDSNANTDGETANIKCRYDELYTLVNGAEKKYRVELNYLNPLKQNEILCVEYDFLGWIFNDMLFDNFSEITNLSNTDKEVLTFQAVWQEKHLTLQSEDKLSHTFLGWFSDYNYENYLGIGGENVLISVDMNLYCKWEIDARLGNISDDDFVNMEESIKNNGDGTFTVEGEFTDGIKYDTKEDAMVSAGENLKKLNASVDISDFYDDLSQIGGEITDFSNRINQSLSSIVKTENGFFISENNKFYSTLDEAVQDRILTVKKEILEEKKKALEGEINAFLHECDGKEVITSVEISSSNIENIELEDVGELSDVYNDALLRVRLAKAKQLIVNIMTEQMNAFFANSVFTKSSLEELYQRYLELGALIDGADSLDIIDEQQVLWEKSFNILRVSSKKDLNNIILGEVSSEKGIIANAVLTIEEIKSIETDISNYKKLKAYGSYNIKLSASDKATYKVAIKLPNNTDRVKTFYILHIKSDGSEELIEAVSENGYLIFEIQDFSEFIILGKPPVSLAWILLPLAILLALFIAYCSVARKEKRR